MSRTIRKTKAIFPLPYTFIPIQLMLFEFQSFLILKNLQKLNLSQNKK